MSVELYNCANTVVDMGSVVKYPIFKTIHLLRVGIMTTYDELWSNDRQSGKFEEILLLLTKDIYAYDVTGSNRRKFERLGF